MAQSPDTPEFRAAVAEVMAHEALYEAIVAAVANCPDRGPVLPVSMQGDGCKGRELSECRAGKGDIPGRVCLIRCLECRAEALSPSP